MSNPTTHVETFDSSLGAFTGVQPIRYDSGLWLEEATTNYAINPVGGVNTFGFNASTNMAIERTATLPGPLPGWLGGTVTTTFRLYATADKSPGILASLVTAVDAAGMHQTAMLIWIPTAFGASAMVLRANNFVGGTNTDGPVNMALRDQWQVVNGSIDVNAGDLSGHLAPTTTAGTVASGQEFWVTALSCQPGAYRTSPAIGSAGSGFSWVGTAHLSASTRAASSASISPTGILAPGSGALAFRITPTIETGLEEIWGECGVKGAGTDHLRWGRDASTHPFVEWSSNDAAYQRLTASETLAAGTAYDLYFGHTGTVTSLAVDAGTLQTGTRDAVSGDFSTGDLTLEASAGGVIYQPFATFNRTLTAKEIATLNGKNNWTMNVLAGNPYRNFQLRPY